MGNNITDIKQLLNDETDEKHFSFEVLPPLKGNGTASLFRNIDQLKEFNPSFINITTHHSEFVYYEREDGLLERQRIRRRPGTVAIAVLSSKVWHSCHPSCDMLGCNERRY